MPQPPAPPTDPWGAPLPGPPGQKHQFPAPAPIVSPPPSDPWGSPAKPAPSNQSDPWGMPMPSNPSPPQANPGIIHDSFVLKKKIFSCCKFGSISIQCTFILCNFLLKATAAGDPLGAPVPSSGASASSPWGGSPVPTQQPACSGFDSGTSSMTNGGTKPTVDDDFDLLSSRNTAESPAKAAVTDSLDLLGSMFIILKFQMFTYYSLLF